jgi:3'-phosphoadenosine 5'-phosphosulfate sulfotransferase (PAPS reductase)/FAD synthetase
MTDTAQGHLLDEYALTPERVLAMAEEQYGPFVARVCLFSGGNDSLATAHRARDHYDELVFIDTGTAVPGVRDFVVEAADWIGKPLRIYDAGDEYKRMVLGSPETHALIPEAQDLAAKHNGDIEAALRDLCIARGVKLDLPMGFPGPGMHGRCYNRLKERQIERFLREVKDGHPRSARVLFITGVRRAESQRRSKRAPVTKKGAQVFANPLIEWTTPDLHAYRAANKLPESDVAALLHRSGECNCGAYATPGEREELRSIFPKWFAEVIAPAEEEATRLGLPNRIWGAGRDTAVAGQVLDAVDPLCTDCELRLDLGTA